MDDTEAGISSFFLNNFLIQFIIQDI